MQFSPTCQLVTASWLQLAVYLYFHDGRLERKITDVVYNINLGRQSVIYSLYMTGRMLKPRFDLGSFQAIAIAIWYDSLK